MTQSFDAAYKQLNPEQKEAVDTIDGPVMVVAGPGTGKTQILTLRIARILKDTDTEPENILALTFTEAAVHNMRKRLVSMIGADAYRVNIFTFHGFAQHIITTHPDAFPEIIGSEPISTIEQTEIISSILLEGEYKLLRPFGEPLHYVRDVISGIGNLKREGVTVDEFQKIIDNARKDFEAIDDLYNEKGKYKGLMKTKYKDIEKQINKNEELKIAYEAYQKIIRERSLYDFDDMIIEVVRALSSDKQFLLELQEQYQYLLADEHQDSNNGQNKLLELLADFHESPNIFVVGDEKQSIFRFQGASLENFFYFQHLYKDAKIITLERNYRSTQTILDSAGAVLSGKKPLKAQQSYTEKNIHRAEFEDERSEIFGITEHIKQEQADGTPLHEIAILYQKNKQAFPIAEMLQKQNIPYVIESDQDLFSDNRIKKLVTIIRACADPFDNEDMARLLHIDFFTIDSVDIFSLVRTARQKRGVDDADTIFELLKKDALRADLKLISTDAIEHLSHMLTEWVSDNHNQRLTLVVENIMRQSGLLNAIMESEDMISGMDALDRFFDEVRTVESKKADASLEDLVQYIDTIQEHGIFIKKKKHSQPEDAVRLMTAYKSKGLEFDFVYIVHAVEGIWSKKRNHSHLKLLDGVFELIEDPEKRGIIESLGFENDDDRRVFYVALTRAKKGVMISYARHNAEGREQLPTSFLEEIKKEHIDDFDTSSYEELYKQKRGELYALEIKDNHDRPFSKEFIRELFIKQGLSVSALNNYLKSPWLYFYRNLMRIPQMMNNSLVYGNLIHAALADFFNSLAQGENLDKDALISFFDTHMSRGQFSEQDFITMQEKGHRALSAWHDAYHTSWNTRTLNEYTISGIHLRDDIRLTGNIDKIELSDDDTVTVVDYKTGKSKSRNALLGNTKSDSSGDYYRQLVFYKVLLNRYQDGRFKVQHGVIDFIEPDEKGNMHREVFEIPDEDVQELEETIIRVSDEIMNLSFWDESCDPEVCDYCDLVDALKKGKAGV